MRRTISATMVALLLGSAVLIADHQGKQKKHNDARHAKGKHAVAQSDRRDDSAVAVRISWSSREVEIIRRHYAPKYRRLPPGLQKKYARTGQLPPGWQKKMEPFPASLERDCARLPAGYHRGVFDGHAVIYNPRGVIIDVAVLF